MVWLLSGVPPVWSARLVCWLGFSSSVVAVGGVGHFCFAHAIRSGSISSSFVVNPRSGRGMGRRSGGRATGGQKWRTGRFAVGAFVAGHGLASNSEASPSPIRTSGPTGSGGPQVLQYG